MIRKLGTDEDNKEAKREKQVRFLYSPETPDMEEARISSMEWRIRCRTIHPSLRQRLHLSEDIHGKSFHQNLAPPHTPRENVLTQRK